MLPPFEQFQRTDLVALAREFNVKKCNSLTTKALYIKLIAAGAIFDPNQNVCLMTLPQLRAYSKRCNIELGHGRNKRPLLKAQILDILQQKGKILSDEEYEQKTIHEAMTHITNVPELITDLANIIASYNSSYLPQNLVSKRQPDLPLDCIAFYFGFNCLPSPYDIHRYEVDITSSTLTEEEFADIRDNVVGVYFVTRSERQSVKIARHNRWVFVHNMQNAYGPNNETAYLNKISTGWVFTVIQNRCFVRAHRGKLVSDVIKSFTPSFLTIVECTILVQT